jgi:malate synthase
VRRVLDEELAAIAKSAGEEKFRAGAYSRAAEVFWRLTAAEECPEFLTLAAYDLLDAT